MWWPFKRMIEKRLIRSFDRGFRYISVCLFCRLESQYSISMERDSAEALAAQVVNYLKGDDITAVIQNSAEPLKSKIAQIKDQISENAARAMAESKSTREAVVATLRMRAVLEFMLQGESYFKSDLHQRIEKLLCTYGPEFPEEIKPDTYLAIAQRYYQETSLQKAWSQ